MYLSGIPKSKGVPKQGLYWVKQALGYTDFAEPRIMRLEEQAVHYEPHVVLVWRRLEDNSAWPATGRDLYWDKELIAPKDYECLKRIDDTPEKQEDID